MFLPISKTLNSWRPNGDDSGWQIEDALLQETGFVPLNHGSEKLPEFVEPVPTMGRDTATLRQLLVSDHPAQANLRPTGVMEIIYGFRDASKKGSGTGAMSNLGGSR